MALFAVIVRIIRLVRSNILQNPFTLGLALVFFLSFTEVSVYFVYALRGVASMDWERVLSSETRGNLNVKHRNLLYFISPASQFC